MNATEETKFPALRPGAEPQNFAREEDRARLGAVALKAYRSLAKKWGLTNAEAAKLIGISESSWDRVKSGKDLALNQDQMTRVSVLVGIFKGLNLLFADKMADDWVRLPNRGPLFDRRTPIEAMIENGIPFMLDVRRLVDAVRGGI
jgi:uncharacterized protein (DUF2384 family)